MRQARREEKDDTTDREDKPAEERNTTQDREKTRQARRGE